MSNQRQQKPTLTGQRFKTRKRGEKLKGLCLCCPFFKQVSSPPGSMKNVDLLDCLPAFYSADLSIQHLSCLRSQTKEYDCKV